MLCCTLGIPFSSCFTCRLAHFTIEELSNISAGSSSGGLDGWYLLCFTLYHRLNLLLSLKQLELRFYCVPCVTCPEAAVLGLQTGIHMFTCFVPQHTNLFIQVRSAVFHSSTPLPKTTVNQPFTFLNLGFSPCASFILSSSPYHWHHT